MRIGDGEAFVMYYHGIPGMIRLLKEERSSLEDEYSGLRATRIDGLPHGPGAGDPTAALAERAEEKGLQNRLCEIDVRLQILSGDRAAIRGSLDALRSEYKQAIFMRCLNGYSWSRIAAEMGVPDSTARHRYRRAIERLGEELEDTPMVDELLRRARRARP